MPIQFRIPLVLLVLSCVTCDAGDFFDRYFEARVKEIEAGAAVISRDDWAATQKERRRELGRMLGLEPFPERGDLKATVTGVAEHEGIVVENLHYQSLPGLYVTANLYRPKEVTGPLPTILYLCGHSDKKAKGVSYGNKAGYEHHGMWYARNGFVCLVIDTVQLGEIRGEHHGTHRLGKWWWISRGYTPAGVEAWSGIRGLDYLETRAEVDKGKFGVTGRSGGGAYSWWVAALDERVACAAPTAGITTLRDHVVEGHVSGHCDCMFMVNERGWDYTQVAALVAPRPLLIANTDKDPIFPIEGVYDIFRGVRETYRTLDAEKNLGFHIAEGGHQDLQPLNTGEFHWMLRHLRGINAMDTFTGPAVKSIPMEKLKVFATLPEDELNTSIDRSFVASASWKTPGGAEEWADQKSAMMKALKEWVFPARTEEMVRLNQSKQSVVNGVSANRYVISSDKPDLSPELDLFLLHAGKSEPRDLERLIFRVMDQEDHDRFIGSLAKGFPKLLGKDESSEVADESFDEDIKMIRESKTGVVWFSPRGIGPTNRKSDPKDDIHFRRKFYLIGETLESNQVMDIRRAMISLRKIFADTGIPIELNSRSTQAVNALYASVLGDAPARLVLRDLPGSHMDAAAPPYLNVLRYLDVPQTVALAAEKLQVILTDTAKEKWDYSLAIGRLIPADDRKRRGVEVRGVE